MVSITYYSFLSNILTGFSVLFIFFLLLFLRYYPTKKNYVLCDTIYLDHVGPAILVTFRLNDSFSDQWKCSFSAIWEHCCVLLSLSPIMVVSCFGEVTIRMKASNFKVLIAASPLKSVHKWPWVIHTSQLFSNPLILSNSRSLWASSLRH